jgi:hypothetical protein
VIAKPRVAKNRRPADYFVLDQTSGSQEYVVYKNSFQTALTAVLERVFYIKDRITKEFRPPTPPIDFGVFSNWAKRRVGRYLPTASAISKQQFVDMYRGKKRDFYQRRLDKQTVDPFQPRRDSKVKIFVKREKQAMKAGGIANTTPRIISPRDPGYNIEVGVYLKPIEKRLFKTIGKLFNQHSSHTNTTIFKGLNALQRGKLLKEKWSKFKKPVAIGLDVRRFDQHYHVLALKLEHWIYTHCFRGSARKALASLLRLQLHNTCVGYFPDGTIRYKVEGRRMSGDMNTALGNCLMMTLMILYFFEHNELTAELANDGDDCVVICESSDKLVMDGLGDWLLSLGFETIVEEPVYVLEQIVFCQCQPIYSDGTYIMVRDPRLAISKDAICLKDMTREKDFNIWISSVGQCGMSLTGGIPVWQDFYQSMILVDVPEKCYDDPQWWTGMKRLSEGMSRTYTDISDDTRLSFWRAFGFSPGKQLDLEEFYRTHPIKWEPPEYGEIVRVGCI